MIELHSNWCFSFFKYSKWPDNLSFFFLLYFFWKSKFESAYWTFLQIFSANKLTKLHLPGIKGSIPTAFFVVSCSLSFSCTHPRILFLECDVETCEQSYSSFISISIFSSQVEACLDYLNLPYLALFTFTYHSVDNSSFF